MKVSYFHGRIAILWGVFAVAVAYISWQFFQHSLTGHAYLTGWMGVLGGLFVCSQPAANIIDLLFFNHHAVENLLNIGEWITWITLNLLVFFLGCLMITVGVTHFATIMS